ncbi:pecanex-like protein 4 isoform X1 [Girardinichthys multiradiatus]|uniref:pecanex-like protein 4 isoform X1 n=1 Tax=Girardinichthys multiradiatus TaxID=208333 RepID=UPI001FAB55EB|nr:pecanex-like protein 4 isoform X1 [Girardinichthys multiradiatus]XP_047200859.1 pecanex-like protein 4 isoform X1 [Girardinichthys multiradiatus]
MVRMGPDVPLLNEYKQEFFWKRFPQTVLGGPRFKLGYCAPPYVYVNQAVLFLTPWLFGGVGTLLCQLQLLQELYAAVLSGTLMFAAAAGVQALALYAARRSGTVVERLGAPNILIDEEEVEFTHCVSPETVRFIAPGKRFGLNVVLHTVLAGVLCGLGTWYVFLGRLTALYGSTGVSLIVFVLSWVTLCIAEYSLIVNTAAETATFQAQDTYEITPLTRPLYIFIFIALDLADRFSHAVPELQLASQTLHVVFVFLPLLWALGVLPPLDALLLWGMEQALVFGLGGSPMSSNIRLLLMFAVSFGVAVCNYFIPSTLGVVLFSTSAGFLLSLDLSQVDTLCRRQRIAFRDHRFHSGAPLPLTSFGWNLGCRELLLYLSLLVVAMAEAGLLHYFLGSAQSQDLVTRLQGPVRYLLLILFSLCWALREVQGAYVVGGMFLNPLYPKGMSNVQSFKQKNRGLHIAAAIRRVLLYLVSPFAMIAFLSMDKSLRSLHSVSISVGLTRAFRGVWQSSEDALLQMVVVVLVQLAAGNKTLPGWDTLGTGVQLLLVGLLMDRLSQFLAKLKFTLTVLVTSWTEKKQRRQSAGTLLALNASLWPLVLAVVMLSALLSAPLLPLFTLPIFLVGFPRPQRSWPGPVGTACPCPDSVFYQQMSGSLASALRTAFASGSLGSVAPGSHFLGRFQDRMVWIMILERGYGYCTVNIKGLELQETSCHTVEARRVDEVFEAAFERPERLGFTQGFNLHWGNALTPCAALAVRVYSDARNVLSGIIDSHDNLRKLQEDFMKALIWLLLRYCVQRHKGLLWSSEVGSGIGGMKSQSSQLAQTTCNQLSEAVVVESNMSSLRFRQDSSSLTSFGDWSDEDDLFGPQPARRTVALVTAEAQPGHSALQIGASLPGSVEMDSLFENMALSALQPLQPLGLGIGMPAVDKGRNPEVLRESPHLNFSCPESEVFNLPLGWKTAPLLPSRLLLLRPLFPEEWFRFSLGRFGLAVQGETSEDMTKGLKEDEVLKELHVKIALSCLISVGAESAFTSPSYIYRLYCGDVPWTEGLDWLSSSKELYQLTLQAFRFSFKLLFDQASLGPMESPEELFSTLEEYERDWYIGLVTEKGWHDSVLQEKPFLFSLGHDLTMGTYTGRVLSLQEQLVQVGRLNGEGVRGQWANLSWELLYATNDDEERYSIQAHPFMLRNLTVQAADPPLGYPIYSSAPLHFPCL